MKNLLLIIAAMIFLSYNITRKLLLVLIAIVFISSCTKENFDDNLVTNDKPQTTLTVEIMAQNNAQINSLYIINSGGVNWQNSSTRMRYTVNCTTNDKVRIKILKDCELKTKYDIHIWNNKIDTYINNVEYYDNVFTIE